MSTKINKLEAAQNALETAERAATHAAYLLGRVSRACRNMEAGALTEADEDTLIDACRIKIGNLAFYMNHAELAAMAREVRGAENRAAHDAWQAAITTLEAAEKAAYRRRRAA